VTITDSTVSGNRSVFQGGGISSGGGNLTISKTTFADNQAGDAGGAIFVEGMLNVYSSAILNNSASEGGGIHIEGDAFMPTSEVMILGSRISGNTATGDGGGISSNSESNITINGSTLNDNIAGGDGGGVRHGRLFNVGGGTVAVVNSTLSGNTAGGFGGGVDGINGSLIDLRYTTLAFNAANFGGSLGTFAGSSSRAEHTIFANSVGADECSPGLGLSLGHNLASDDSCNLFLPTDIENADPLLEPLADNGGSTPTHALLPGSPAIDAGVSNPVTCLSFDQRGVFRPLDGDGDLMAACDVGAYEAPPPPIDDFTSADHPMGQLGPNWRGAKSPHSYRVVDDMLDVEEGGPVYWHRDTFGPDQQAFVTLAKVDPNGQHHSVLLKAQDNARGLPDWRRGAVAVFYDAVTQQVGVESYVPGRGWRVEGVRDSIVLKDGDQLGGRVKSGATAVVFVNGSFLFETSIDPFFDGKGGRIGLWFIVAADAVLDDFSGATVAP
jgi:predicted outer membrane repeat protein